MEKGKQLKALLEKRIVYEKDGYYCGIASDGVEVSFGMVGEDEKSVERYFEKHSSSTNW